MNKAEFDALKATFPWTTRVAQVGIGGTVQVIDRHGKEVPLFAMTEFLEVITHKLADKAGEDNKEAA